MEVPKPSYYYPENAFEKKNHNQVLTVEYEPGDETGQGTLGKKNPMHKHIGTYIT